MQFTLLTTLALFAASALAQEKTLSLNQRPINQCERTTLSYPEAQPPYNIIVTSAAEPCGEPLQVIGNRQGTYVRWTPNSKIRAGQKVLVSVLSSDDYEGWTEEITVGGTNTTCIGGSSSSSTDTATAANVLPTGSTTTTDDTTTDGGDAGTDGGSDDPDSPELLGAAKAAGGLLGSSAGVNARVAAPVMALSALAGLAVLAL